MTNLQLYGIGYTGRQVSDLLTLAQAREAIIFDIRYKPVSRFQPQWNKGRLIEALGAHYAHLPEFGNLNYKAGDHSVALVDYEGGKAKLVDFHSNGLEVGILLCTCKDPTFCHRTTVGQMLARDGFSYEEFSPTGTPALL